MRKVLHYDNLTSQTKLQVKAKGMGFSALVNKICETKYYLIVIALSHFIDVN